MTGAATPACSSARASSGTDSSASTAWPIRSGISAAGTPCGEQLAGPPVAALGRQGRCDEVAGAGEADHRLRPRTQRLGVAPDLGEDVPGGGSGRVQALRLGGAGSERRGVLRRPGELDPDGVVGLLADHPRADEQLGDRPRQVLVARGRHQGRAGVDHLLRVGGSAEACHAVGAETSAEHDGRRKPVGRHEPLGNRDDRRPLPDARPRRLSIASPNLREGTARNT